MEGLFLSNLTSPPLLFFFLGMFAVWVRSDLEIPQQIAKFLSLYLLFAIGIKGGLALSESALTMAVAQDLLAAVAIACIVPFAVFFALRKRFNDANAAAVAATYGSVSAVTFVTCISYLDQQQIAWGGHLVAAMALMESPAIIIGIVLYRRFAKQDAVAEDRDGGWSELLREGFLNGSVLLILGSLLIGWVAGKDGAAPIIPFSGDLFLGMLCLFLLDMGIVAARRFADINDVVGLTPKSLVLTALLIPPIAACFAASVALALGMTEGNALLFTVLGASASYIAVPAAMRLALPEANPSTYLPMSLAITFPFNILLGIPLYHQLIIWGAAL